MTVTVISFRTQYPEFTVALYSDQAVTFWLDIAMKRVNPNIWTDLTDLGVLLFTAHNCLLSNLTSSAQGGNVNIANSKSVDRVSVSFDTTTSSNQDAGTYNLTTYGKQFWEYSRLFGMGALQL